MEIIWYSPGPSEDIVQVMDLFLIKVITDFTRIKL